MELTQKKRANDGIHYYFHRVGKWFLLIKHKGYFETQLRYGFSEEVMLMNLPFETTIAKTINNVEDIGKIHYASFLTEHDDEIVLLGMADFTIVARECPLEVVVEEKPFEHYYSEYLTQYELIEPLVCINLPEDEITRIVMIIDDFHQDIDGEYAFNSIMDIDYFKALSETRDNISVGNIGYLIDGLQVQIDVCDGSEHDVELAERARKIISELMLYRNKKSFLHALRTNKFICKIVDAIKRQIRKGE